MPETSRPLIVGNWKMNGGKLALKELGAMIEGYDAGLRARVELLVCPPATLLHAASVIALGSGIRIGAQDCHAEAGGAHTGDLAAAMLADCGATHVLAGHSERRQNHGETDAAVSAKAAAAHAAGAIAVVCVGETAQQRRDAATIAVVKRQLSRSLPLSAIVENTIIAYEPVWAIGTGLTPSSADIAEVHAALRAGLKRRFGKRAGEMRILYGGSVKPGNAREILGLANVNGALVGGASLKAADFLAIAKAC